MEQTYPLETKHNLAHEHHNGEQHDHLTPTARLAKLAFEERSDLFVLITYTVIAGLLALIVPLGAQALVNTIAANVLLQPVVVLTFLTFGGLVFAGILQLLKLGLVEVLQQRIFARTALMMAEHLINVRTSALRGEYAPEVVNRFFDVLTVQKALSKLLIDGLATSLQAIVGLILLGFYSPYLLGFDILILIFIVFVIAILGIGGLRTSIDESREKYKVASWLEELARCHTSMKLHGAADYLLRRADHGVLSYLRARQLHFKVYQRQAAGSYLFQAIASAGVLAVGGYLVINRQLTLGQLVASQIIVVSLLAAMEKLVRQADQVFDLLTGLDKIGHVLDMTTERTGGRTLPESKEGVEVQCWGVRFAYQPGDEILTGLNLSLQAGERVSLVGASGAGKSTLASLLCGLEEPSHGTVTIDGYDVRDLALDSLRRTVTLVGYNNEIFEGTIEDNITVGRAHLTQEDIRHALEMACLIEDVARMPQGTKTLLVSGGQNLSRGQAQRLLIARALVGMPRLLILDEAFTGIDEKTTMQILDAIYAPEHAWTIIDISHEAEVVLRSGIVHVLAKGQIVETGTPDELAAKTEGEFSRLFPYLSKALRERIEASSAPAPVISALAAKKAVTRPRPVTRRKTTREEEN